MPRLRPVEEPTKYGLQENGRRFPPNFLHESWRDFLYWDSELESRGSGPRRDGLSGRLQALRQPDGQPRAGLHRTAQQLVGRCLLGAVLQTDVAVLQLFLPERLDGVLQRRLVALQRLLLAGVVLVDEIGRAHV